MAGGGVTSREQTLSLLSAVKNHGDLAVKLSSLRQAKDIILSVEPSSLVVELFPYIVELQGSNEVLVRKILLELMEELGLKVMDQSSVFMPVFLTYLKDDASSVVRQSIVSGTNFFCSVLEEMALQYHQSGKVDRWLEELWSWMVKFKDAICGIALESGPIGTKLLAIKFWKCMFYFSRLDAEDDETSSKEVKGQNFNISWVVGANRSLGYLLDMLRSAKTLPGCVTITVINCLAAIARKRPMHYTDILSALIGFDPNFETPGSHTASIQYSFRTAFLGFLRCTHPCIVESRDRLVRALRAMNAGDAADRVIRKVDKIIKNTERDQSSNHFLSVSELNKKRSMLPDVDSAINTDELPAKRTRIFLWKCTLPVQNNSGHDGITSNGVSTKVPLLQNELTPVEQMIAMIAALLAEGERGAKSLEILISQIQPDLMADIVIANMRHLPKNLPPLSSRLGNMPPPSPSGPITTAQVAVPNVPTTTSAVYSFQSQAVTHFFPQKQWDPRRLDPRRPPAPAAAVQPLPAKEEITDSRFAFDASFLWVVLCSHLSDIIMDLEPVLSPEQPDFSVLEPELQDSDMMDFDQEFSGTSAPEETFLELPPTAADQDIISMVQKHIVSDYEHQKGHELAMHVLYHLRSAKSLRDTLPFDKSFSRFLGEVPLCLGAVWSLILSRPLNRECSVHPQEDVRAKAIRCKQTYRLSYASEKFEEFATNMLLSVIDQRIPDTESSQVGVTESNPDENFRKRPLVVLKNSDPGVVPGTELAKDLHPVLQTAPNVSLSQAQRCMSLFFALCTKKPSLLQLVFDVYGRAPKTVKQAVHRHIPNLVRNLDHLLTEETTPSADLIATVKHLYQTKLKDAILIPMLSSLSQRRGSSLCYVLPIFPQLVGLPLDKFQAALALYSSGTCRCKLLLKFEECGSAHTGPALTPAEVLVAIHGSLTVFTQQVSAKALNQLVDQTPLSLLFMRTVIQAIDAFPTLVIKLSVVCYTTKLVNKQLPPPQLESTLNRHANLRAGLINFWPALGLANEPPPPHAQRSYHPSALHPETGSSVQGATNLTHT
ncbi:hypothetical protein MKW92_007751 [Papaver armeniacum]|nr:hypothetical protein MKW92_007751 [Papaver armeniacum]